MLGFGELLAHEFAFRLGWSATNVTCDPCPQFASILTLSRFGLGIDLLIPSDLVSKSETVPVSGEEGTAP